MTHPAFPDCPFFAWAFCLVLVGITTAAAYTDFRTMTIPKVLTIPALLLGVIFNVVRGVWVGSSTTEMGPWLGGWNGFLLALAGFVVGFGLFFILWVLRTCRGGDVKLFAAVAAWVGPVLAVFLLLLTVVCVGLIAMGRFAVRLVQGGSLAVATSGGARGATLKKGAGAGNEMKERLVYAPALVLSLGVLLLWVFRAELHLDSLR